MKKARQAIIQVGGDDGASGRSAVAHRHAAADGEQPAKALGPRRPASAACGASRRRG
ncbi:hypothetical protein [Bradyrhizobium sp. CCBAU 21365]|uniref:hypothetical protein n=1 Tax=Bradyrhizobium sp. CCBAU 21365 TaxID=1325083 RepID=UPI00188B376C|nr:hypothetical protein [Bradyrhizobium sp. CCBAU 21365]